MRFLELGRKDDDAADVIAELRRAASDHAQVLVLHIVQEDMPGHRILQDEGEA
jgi:hypothetical protein